MVATTCVLSGVSVRLFTVPKTMSLYLSCDWPACSPSPLSKVILIVGPSLDSVSQASHAPIATATSGMIQMMTLGANGASSHAAQSAARRDWSWPVFPLSRAIHHSGKGGKLTAVHRVVTMHFRQRPETVDRS